MENTLPTSPANSRFGSPKPTRIEEFTKLLTVSTGATTRIVFQAKNVDIPIIRVPIELPKYRMVNGRTVSLQEEHLAKNPTARPELFSGDAELWDAQEAQHNLLLQLAKKSDLQHYFEDSTNIQVDPILLDENGFVVNGNRRLATWRELLFKFPDKYGHFRHIDVAVLPHCDEREIDRLEATLQIEPDIKADYSWDAKANMMLAKQKRDGFSNRELAELYGMKESDVAELLDMRSYADEYLRSRHKTNLWSRVSAGALAFKRIVTSRAKISGVGKQTVFKEAAFTLIDNPDEADDSLHDAIHNLLGSLDQITEKLQDEFKPVPAADTGTMNALFGGAPALSGGDALAIPLAQAIQKPENGAAARKIIVDVIETQKQLKKDSKTADFLITCCAKAHALLAAAVKDGFRAEAKLEGVGAQLDQIQIHLDKIRTYLSSNVKD